MRYQKFRYWIYRARHIHPLPLLILFLLFAVYCLHHYPFPTFEHPVYINSLKKRASIPYKPPDSKIITESHITESQIPIGKLGITKDLVIAATTSSNLKWLSQLDQEDWRPYIYITNATSSLVSATEHTYTVPLSKGNEAMAYLTHIIDNYDNLADVTVFHHDHYTSWHQDFPSPIELSLLQPSHVLRSGYVSTRCSKTGNCSDLDTIKLSSLLIPLRELSLMETRAAQIPSLLMEFLGREETLRILGEGSGRTIQAPCCAMFAVSREMVRKRDIGVWRGLREWLIQTDLDSWAAGRILEWTWHIWFGMDAVL